MKGANGVRPRDLWLFPPMRYGVELVVLDSRGRGTLQEVQGGAQRVEFVWGSKSRGDELFSKPYDFWMARLEEWLDDQESDLSFSRRAARMSQAELDRQCIATGRATPATFERCLASVFLLDREFMRVIEVLHGVGHSPSVDKFGVLLDLDEAGVSGFSLWLRGHHTEPFSPEVMARLKEVISWFCPRRDNEKIARYSALRRHTSGQTVQSLYVEVEPVALSAFGRLQTFIALRDQLLAHVSPFEAQFLFDLLDSPS